MNHAKAPGAKCNVCPLRQCDFVPPERNPSALFAVVGDYPMAEEVRELRPFMGFGGQEITGAFRQAGIQRGGVHWTTSILCSPPEGRLDRFLHSIRKKNKKIEAENRTRKKEGSEPLPLIPSPQQCCAPRLHQELDGFHNLVVCGTTAAKAIIHSSASIMALRGGPMELDRFNADGTHRALRVLPTFHPAFVTKAKRWTAVFRQDIHRAVRWFTSGSLEWSPPELIFHPPADQLAAFLSTPNVPYWTYDVETDGIECLTANLRCIGIGTPSAVVIVGFLSIDGRDRFYSPTEERKVVEVLKRFFEDDAILKAGHNSGYYDLIVMREQLGIDVKPNIDTMLLHRLVESELPHSLGFVGSVYTEAPSWKTNREGKKKAYGSETDEELHIYCGYDVAVTAAVLNPLWTQVKLRQQDKVSSCDHKLQKICADMHIVGMHVDQVERKKWEQKFLKETYERRSKVREVSGRENLNPASVLQLRELLFNEWRLDPQCEDKVRFTKNGDPSTSDDVLRSLLAIKTLTPIQRKVITEIRLYRRAQKLLGTYVTKLRYNTEDAWGGWDDDDTWMDKEWRDRYGLKKLGIVYPDTDRMHPGYNCHGTTSGRLSSSQPINAQNFPGSLRAMVTCAPGHVLVGADMDQLELRIAASRWNSQTYLEAFTAGLDPHSSVTSMAIFGERFEKAAIECGAGPFPWKTGTKFKGTAKNLRGLAKCVQYASQYSASVSTVHKVITQTEIDNGDGTTALPYLSLSVPEVRIMHDKWCEGAKFDLGWRQEIAAFKAYNFISEPIHGRRRDFLDGGENLSELVNFPIQSSAAALMNEAIIELAEIIPLHKWGVGTGIINQCHDSIVVECPIEYAEWVSQQIEAAMNRTHPAFPGIQFTAAADTSNKWSEV
jgi:DNA polymerase I-like protein with 3'-5' exonuclease and polymerase domains/uracil-DNA glycosylase